MLKATAEALAASRQADPLLFTCGHVCPIFAVTGYSWSP